MDNMSIKHKGMMFFLALKQTATQIEASELNFD